jgi:DEAD/DEAH box helicase domain-containing protein
MDDGEAFGERHPGAILEHFESERIARRTGGRTYWAADAYPAEEVSLRTATPQNFIVHDTSRGNRVLAEIDYDSAAVLIHPQAIYMHQGETYHVDSLDWDRRDACVRPIDTDYYTDAISKSDLVVLQRDLTEAAGNASEGGRFNPLLSRSFGEVKVSTTVPKFKKVKFETHESVGYGEIHLPQIDLQTEAAWWTLREETRDWLARQRLDLGGALAGLAWAMHNIVALHVMSDPRDLATLPMVQSPFDGRPTIYLYDRAPGGIGLARRAFGMDRQILRSAMELVSGCACGGGCPSCVGPALEADSTAKAAARALLAATIDG